LLHPASVNELEWSLLRARLSQVEDSASGFTVTGIGSCCAQYRYDSDKSKIVARFFYSPSTLNRLTVQEAKERLSNAAIGAIEAAKFEVEQQSGVKLDEKDFEVEFATWGEHAQFKMFAVYRDNQVELVSTPLK
jgi:hypothetical protein